MKRKNKKYIFLLLIAFSANLIFVQDVLAVVGKAVGLSEFEEQDLNDFHAKLIDEERSQVLNKYDDINRILALQQASQTNEGVELEEALKRDIEILKTQLLSLPKRDRIRYELRGDYSYDSNISRGVPRQEKGDSVFNQDTTILLDLSGKKTDFRFDLGLKKQWNIHFPERDEWQVEERLRFRRKYFKKVLVSSNSRIARNNTKTIEIDENKIRWDFNNQMAINFPVSKKLGLNLDMSSQKRLFRQEAFDQDSSRQAQVAPTAFLNLTPKSRVQLGYRFGVSRIRSKTGDSNSQDLALGYFGKLSRKSSMSFNAAYNRQDPRSTDTASVNTITLGLGHAWQLTPKTQLSSQVTRSMQNTTSNLTSGSVNGANTVVRSDTRITTDNLSFSVNTRLLRKLTTTASVAMTHSKTTVRKADDPLEESRQWTFPVSFNFSYAVRRWMTWSAGYAFSFRTGNEKSETSRSHLWKTDVRMLF